MANKADTGCEKRIVKISGSRVKDHIGVCIRSRTATTARPHKYALTNTCRDSLYYTRTGAQIVRSKCAIHSVRLFYEISEYIL